MKLFFIKWSRLVNICYLDDYSITGTRYLDKFNIWANLMSGPKDGRLSAFFGYLASEYQTLTVNNK
jgi:hypothetical protein